MHPGCPRPFAGSQEAPTELEEKKAPKKPQGMGEPDTKGKARDNINCSKAEDHLDKDVNKDIIIYERMVYHIPTGPDRPDG